VIPRNVQKIAHFMAVAKARSLSEAARQLGISQPALTASIRKLEAALGFELFDREHGFRLTVMGGELLSRAESAFTHLRDLERELVLLRSGALGEIRIACGPTVADAFVGRAIGRMVKAHPEVAVKVRVGAFAEMPMLLRDRHIDFFVADFTLLEREADLEILPLAPQEILFFCRAGHPLAGREVGLEEFFSYPHVGPGLPAWAKAWLDEHRPAEARARDLRVECSHHALLKAVVESSDALSGAPRPVIQSDLDGGRFSLVRLAARTMHNQAGIVWLKGRPPSPAGRLLIEQLENLASEGAGAPPPGAGT
jgi:DNA-binding transcriptional LysR family regulator